MLGDEKTRRWMPSLMGHAKGGDLGNYSWNNVSYDGISGCECQDLTLWARSRTRSLGLMSLSLSLGDTITRSPCPVTLDGWMAS